MNELFSAQILGRDALEAYILIEGSHYQCQVWMRSHILYEFFPNDFFTSVIMFCLGNW